MLVGFLERNCEAWRRYCQFYKLDEKFVKNSKKLAVVNYAFVISTMARGKCSFKEL